MSERPDDAAPSDQELAGAIRDLSASVAELRDDLRRAPTPLPPEPESEADDGHAWLAVMEAPERRRPAAPRFLLEALFLGACAAAAAIADLDAVAILGVMVGAWVLVALIEWAASRADRRREELLLAQPPIPVPASAAAPPDPSWYAPPVERTMLDVADVESTAVTRLPPREDELEATVEHRAGG